MPSSYQRVTDEMWAAQLKQSPPADPAWVSDLVAR